MAEESGREVWVTLLRHSALFGVALVIALIEIVRARVGVDLPVLRSTVVNAAFWIAEVATFVRGAGHELINLYVYLALEWRAARARIRAADDVVRGREQEDDGNTHPDS